MSVSLDALLVSADEARTKTWTHHLWQVGSMVNARRVDNVGEFLSAVLTKPWDVILLSDDCGALQPEMVFQCLRETSADIPVILMVSELDAVEAVRLMSLGASDLIGADEIDRLPAALKRSRLVTDHRHVATGVAQSNALATEIFRSVAEGIVVLGRSMTFRTINPSMTRLTAFTPEDLIGRNLTTLIASPDDDPSSDIWQALQAAGSWEGELTCRKKAGSSFIAWFSFTAICDDDGEITEAVGIVSDITERKREADRVWRQANFDHLTDLPNRACFFDRFDSAIDKCIGQQGQLALIYIDLDFFKSVNDTLGHAAGDELLIQAAKRMQSSLREDDLLARLGGDEFAILVSESVVEASARAVSEKILAQLLRPFNISGQDAYVSASIGIAVCPDYGTQSDDLLTKADRAMYRAKHGGRNRYCFYDAKRDAIAGKHIAQNAPARLKPRGADEATEHHSQAELETEDMGAAEANPVLTHPRPQRRRRMAQVGIFALTLALFFGTVAVLGNGFFESNTDGILAEPDPAILNDFEPAAGPDDNAPLVSFDQLVPAAPELQD